MNRPHRSIPPSRRRPLLRWTACLLITSLLVSGCGVTPQPLTMESIGERAEQDRQSILAAGFEHDPETPLTLYAAMARALKFNLDHRMKLMEQALAVQQLDVTKFDLLPQLTASAGYNARNNDEGSFSQSLIDGSQSLVASTSRERVNHTADLTIMWNVLDFGVSYTRAKQQADRVLILEERRRKVIQNIIQDVRYAYWRAVCAEQLIGDMVELLQKSKTALQRTQQIAAQKLQSPRETLEYQRALLENIRLLWTVIQQLTPAKVELASLVNLPPGLQFSLEAPNPALPEIPAFQSPSDEMERIALLHRPELREEDYRARISALDVRKALLQMLPGLSFEVGASYDSNQFLYNQSWWNVGALVSQSLMRLAAGPQNIRAAEAQQEIDEVRRRAVSMAVMVQVHLALQRFGLVRKEYFVSRHLDTVNTQLSDQTFAAKKAGGASDLESIKAETGALLARMRHLQAYAELQNAAGRLYNSLGIDLIPSEIESTEVAALASSIAETFAQWNEKLNAATPVADGAAPTDQFGVDVEGVFGMEAHTGGPVVHGEDGRLASAAPSSLPGALHGLTRKSIEEEDLMPSTTPPLPAVKTAAAPPGPPPVAEPAPPVDESVAVPLKAIPLPGAGRHSPGHGLFAPDEDGPVPVRLQARLAMDGAGPARTAPPSEDGPVVIRLRSPLTLGR